MTHTGVGGFIRLQVGAMPSSGSSVKSYIRGSSYPECMILNLCSVDTWARLEFYIKKIKVCGGGGGGGGNLVLTSLHKLPPAYRNLNLVL